jgi:hypothetical protein
MTNPNQWMKKGLACLKYCKQQNGLPYCKNCGLTREILEGIKSEGRMDAAREIALAASAAGLAPHELGSEKDWKKAVEKIKANSYKQGCLDTKLYWEDEGERVRQEVIGEISEKVEKELGAGGYPAVMLYLSRLKEQETKE